MEMMELYEWRPKAHIMDTQYGTINYLDWVNKEKQRIEKDPDRVANVLTSSGRCTLEVNRVAESD